MEIERRTTHRQEATPSTTRLVPGDRIGRYAVVGPVGEGGMATVYEALDTHLGRRIALKLPKPGHGLELAIEALRREGRAMMRVLHPGVLPVYEFVEDGPRSFLAMPFVDGPHLRAWLDLRRRDRRDVTSIFIELGLALGAVHRARLVHRDFKPTNALVDGHGRGILIDFGLAISLPSAATGRRGCAACAANWPRTPSSVTGSFDEAWVVGTPAYMAPEQRDGGSVDGGADQYAFCTALYEALEGTRPAARSHGSGAVDLQAAAHRTLGPGRISPHLAAVLVRGMSRDPAHRWPSMEQLVEKIAACQEYDS